MFLLRVLLFRRVERETKRNKHHFGGPLKKDRSGGGSGTYGCLLLRVPILGKHAPGKSIVGVPPEDTQKVVHNPLPEAVKAPPIYGIPQSPWGVFGLPFCGPVVHSGT